MEQCIGTKTGIVLLAVLSLFFGSCSGGGGSNPPAPTLPKPLAEQYKIDGIVDLSVFSTVTQTVIVMKDAFGGGVSVGTTTLRYAMVNDERHLYIAMVWTDATPTAFDPAVGLTAFDGVVVMFDNDGDGTFEANEDARRLVTINSGTNYGSSYGDIHSVPSPTWNDADSVADGLGKMIWTSGVYHAEFLIPLAPDATGEDGVLTANTRFNINILDDMHVFAVPAVGNIGSLAGTAGMVASMPSNSWPRLPYTVPVPHDQPQIPNNLTGLIAFISDHENPAGELYTFNPATKVVTRVTQSTGLYMDGISLSHDRTRLAFYGGPSTTDYSTWEIYTVNTNSTGLKTLTTNTVLDGHPAWSPDDSKIVYASFRDGWNASIVTMTSATGSELQNLTPLVPGINENDPDWLPDGRIVFKTNRFNISLPIQMRIAVMSETTSTLATQLTNSLGTSDHDPTATNTVAVFERFTKDTDYSQDPSFIFSPWNIVEARIDGSGERTLVADGWVNWLPVYDPTGQYLVYLKTAGYTDARLMTKDGRDLGRLIPNITKIRYIDWK